MEEFQSHYTELSQTFFELNPSEPGERAYRSATASWATVPGRTSLLRALRSEQALPAWPCIPAAVAVRPAANSAGRSSSRLNGYWGRFGRRGRCLRSQMDNELRTKLHISNHNDPLTRHTSDASFTAAAPPRNFCQNFVKILTKL